MHSILLSFASVTSLFWFLGKKIIKSEKKMYILKWHQYRLDPWPIMFNREKKRRKQVLSDVNCSGHLNCNNFEFWCSLSITFFYLPCHFFPNLTCKDALSLARESLLDKHGKYEALFLFILWHNEIFSFEIVL